MTKRNKRPWAPEEIAYLETHYPDTKSEAVAAHLNRPLHSVYNKVYAMGLKKSEAYLLEEQSGRLSKAHQKGDATRFKKGHPTWNKGMKGLMIGGKEAQFKKGNLPHNTREDGATSIRYNKGTPYRHVRVAQNVWVHEHRVRYEAKHGPVPKGKLLRCIDGDTLNTDPTNWRVIARGEHARLNHNPEKALLNGPFHNLSDNYVATMITMKEPHLKEEIKKYPELIELARTNMQLKREIKKQTLSQ